MEIRDNMTILFYGDSITDAERERESGLDLGKGYVRLISAYLNYHNQDKFFKIINRGIAGDSVHELVKRLDQDCLTFPADVVNILVGVNDSTYRLWVKDDPAPIMPSEFENCYREILSRIMAKNPGVQFVLCTPYMQERTEEHRINKELLKKYVPIVHRLAEEYNGILVPYYEVFEKQNTMGCEKKFTIDGVHPTDAGIYLLAEEWLKAVKFLHENPELQFTA